MNKTLKFTEICTDGGTQAREGIDRQVMDEYAPERPAGEAAHPTPASRECEELSSRSRLMLGACPEHLNTCRRLGLAEAA